MLRMAENTKRVHSLSPASRSANTYKTSGIETTGFDGVYGFVTVGTISAGGTVDFKLQESDTDVDGNYVDITDGAITQLTQAGGDSDKSADIDVRLGGRGNRKKYIRGVLVTATNAALCAVEIILYGAHAVPTVNSPVSKLVA